ncbi:MAG TPA: hypothetical protein VFX28_10000, partial [Methylomirabilota bacterium]|nr:hypothetical protein [Methylomirabilota bacterium]
HGLWRLPRSHQYEIFSENRYVRIDLTGVPARLDRGERIYDRTAKAWVLSGDGPGTAYLAPPAVSGDFAVVGEWRVPRANKYEVYVGEAYRPIDLAAIPYFVQRRTYVYDRTAGVWVFHATTGKNARYLAAVPPPTAPAEPPAAPGPPAVAAPAGEDVILKGKWRLPRSHQYEVYGADGQYVKVAVESVPDRLDKGQSIYDRTARAWVQHPAQGVNAAYVVVVKPGAGARPDAPRTKDDCQKDGWRAYTNPSFKNQGECISWVNRNR